MSETKTKVQYLSLDGLKTYDGLIKKYVDDADAKSVKAIVFDATTNTISFYKIENPTSTDLPAYKVEITKQDLSNYLEKISGGVVGDVVTVGADGTVVDSGIKAADLAMKSEVEALDEKVGDIPVDEEGAAVASTVIAYAEKVAADEADAAKEAIEDEIGSLADLTTTVKDTIVGAVNEVKEAVDNTKTDSKVTITTDITTEGAAKSYTVKQGNTEVAVIDIPKDMVVSSGVVETYTEETLPTGEGAPTAPGTYIVLTIANKAASKLYIPADKFVDIYTAQKDAAQIQLTISADNVISAVVVAGSIGTTELADNAITTAKIVDSNVTTAKIADKNVTLDKLSETLQDSIAAADSALQPEDISTGATTGTVSINGTDVEVNGFAELKETVDSYEAIPDETINGLFSSETE